MPADETPDVELLEAYKGGDRAAGDALFKRHFDALYGFFAAKVRAEAVADLVQETLLGCVKGAERFRGEGSFRAYLFGVARYVLYGYFKTKRRNQHHEFDAGVTSLVDLGLSPSGAQWAREEMQLVYEALKHIPLDLQIVLEMHYLQGMSTLDIGIVLDIPQGTVKSRLRRARERVVAQIEALGTNAPLVSSTTANLDKWAASLRGRAGSASEDQ